MLRRPCVIASQCIRGLGGQNKGTSLRTSSLSFLAHSSERACHPERSAPQAREAKDPLSLVSPDPHSLHDGPEKQILRACGAQDDKPCAFLNKEKKKEGTAPRRDLPRWGSCHRSAGPSATAPTP